MTFPIRRVTNNTYGSYSKEKTHGSQHVFFKYIIIDFLPVFNPDDIEAIRAEMVYQTVPRSSLLSDPEDLSRYNILSLEILD